MTRTEKYQQSADGVRADFEKEKAKIDNETQWTAQAKADARRELVVKTNEKFAALREQLQTEKADRGKFLEGKLFAVGDSPAVQRNYRDAIARAGAVAADENQLQELMTQALETNDATLAKGVSFVAQKNGFFDVARQSFDGVYNGYFDEFMELQISEVSPTSKQKLEEGFMFAAVA